MSITYDEAIKKVAKYIKKNTYITYPDGTKDAIAIFDWRELEEEYEEFDYDEAEVIDSYTEPRAAQINDYHLCDEELLGNIESGKWGLFAIAGMGGTDWEIEGFADMGLSGAVVFDLTNGKAGTCPVMTVFAENDFEPQVIAQRIEDLKIKIE